MAKKDKNTFSTAFFLIILVGLAVLAWRSGWIPLGDLGAPVYSPIYDTDPANDKFIKGSLTSEQMQKMDRLLSREQKNNEARLSTELVRELSADDQAVMDAYARWRKCYDMMRSRHHVIYPNQRSKLSEGR